MRKLIDLDIAIDAVVRESQVDGAYGYMDTKSIVDLLNDLASEESEIVKCKNCKNIWHSGTVTIKGVSTKIYKCYLWNHVVSAKGFCHKAERRTDEGD